MSNISSLALECAGTCALHASGTGEWTHLTGRRVTAPGIALGRGLQSQHDAVMITARCAVAKQGRHAQEPSSTDCESDYSLAVMPTTFLSFLLVSDSCPTKQPHVCCLLFSRRVSTLHTP